MKGCILPSFLKPLADKYGTTIDAMKLKVSEYLVKNNLDSIDEVKDLSQMDNFLDSEFKVNPVYQELGGLTFQEVYDQWNAVKEQTFDSKADALYELENNRQKWGEDAVSLFKNNEGKYTLKVAEPMTMDGYTKEMLDILANAPRDKDGNLLAPNGKVSNLSEREYAYVRTTAFKKQYDDWENKYNSNFNFIKNESERNLYQRVSQELNRKINGGNSTLAKLYTFIERRISQTGGEESISKINSSIEEFAHNNNLWINNLDRFLNEKYGEKTDIGGEESEIYFNGNEVIKSTSAEYYDGDIQSALHRVALHNAMFPNTRLNIIGFGRDQKNILRVVLSQPTIRGRYATKEEVSNYIRKLGFITDSNDTNIYNNGEISIADLKPANVLVSDDGNIHVIDEVFADTLERYTKFNDEISEFVDDNGEPDPNKFSADSDYQVVTVAPYFRIVLDSNNKDALRNATQEVKEKAKKLASTLGLKISKVIDTIGTYLGESEVSYQYILEECSPEDADLFASLMGDLSFEFQDAVIAANYTSDRSQANAYELNYIIPANTSPEKIAKILKEANIEGSTYRIEGSNLLITAFTPEEVDKFINTLKKNNYEFKGFTPQNSRYLETADRRDSYQKWLETNRNTQNRKLYNAVSKAYAITKEAAKYPILENVSKEERDAQDRRRFNAANQAARAWDEERKLQKGFSEKRQNDNVSQNRAIEVTNQESQLTQEDNDALEDEFGSKEEREERRKSLDTSNNNTEQQEEEQANRNMLESKTINAKERKYLSNNIMSMLSWIVTSLQSDSEAASNLLGDEYADDYTHMTREEIISKITVSKLLGVVKELFYNPNNPENPSFEYYIENPEIAENLQFVYDNWDAFVKNGYAKLIQLEGFTVTLNHPKEVTQEDVDDAIKDALESGEITGSDNEYWQVGQRQISAKSSLSQDIKREFESLEVEDENSLGAKYGFPQFVDSNLAVESILKWCNNCLTIEEMEETLKSMVGNNPWVSTILEKIQDEPFRSLFFTNFRKDFTNYGAITVTRDEAGNRIFRSIPINTDNAVKGFFNEVLRKYNNGDLSTIFEQKPDNCIVAKKENVEKILKQLNSIFSDIRNAHDNSRNNKPIFYAVARTKVKEIQSILRSAGIDINDNAITQALVERQYQPNFQSNPISIVTSELIQLFESIRKMDSPVNPFEQGEGGIGTNYLHILDTFKMYLPDSIESSVYEAGKMYYSFNVPSYTDKLFRKIQGEKAQEFIEEEYGYTRFFKDNNGKWLCPWLNSLMGEKNTRDNFKHKVQIDFNKIPYTDLGELSYAKSMMAEYFSFPDGQYAWYRVPILSNKPSSEFIKFKRYSGVQYKDRITKGFRSIAQQEIYRIQSIIQKTNPENVAESIKNYDINYGISKDDPKYVNLAERLNNQKLTFEDLVSDGKMRFNTSGAKFHFLPVLNDEIINKTPLGKMLLDKINGKEVNEKEFFEAFNTVIKNSMDAIVAEEIANFDKLGLFKLDINGNYTNIPFSVKSAEMLAAENGVTKRKFTSNGVLDEEAYNKALIHFRDEVRAGINDKLTEYIWNDMFATMNIIELTTTDLAFYKNTEDFQKRFAQIHSPGMRLNTTAKQTFDGGVKSKVIDGVNGKKLTLGGNYSDGKIRAMYISDQILKSALYNDVREIFGEKYKQAKTQEEKERIKDMAKSILKAFEEVNVADAQAYSSPTSYRKKLAMQGKWDDRMEQAYERIKSGDFDVDDLGIVWQPIKPFVFTNMNKTRNTNSLSTMRVPMQNKNSEYMLLLAGALANAKKGSTLAAIFDFMEESAFDANGNYTGKGIDTIQFESAGKTGLMGVVDLNGLSYEEALNKLRSAAYLSDHSENTAQNLTGENYNTNFVHEYNAEDYSIQQEVPAHLLGHAQQMGSQMRILALTDFNDNDELYVKGKDGKNLTAKEAKKEYFRLLADNISDSFEQLRKEIGGKTRLERNRNLEKILKEAILTDQKYGSEMLDACTLNENGEFNIPLDDPIQAIRIQQLLNSIIKTRINKQKITGGPVVQVSNYGLRTDLKVVFEGSGETKRVSHFECMVTCPSEELERDLTVVENGKSRILTIQEAIDRKIITADNPLLKAIGYRIPTEDKYSMVPLKIVGFLPRSAGEGVMLPYDITTLSGSDFDIDKLYMMFKSVSKKEVTNWKKLEDDIMLSAKTDRKAKRDDVRIAIDMIKNGQYAFSEDTVEMAVYDYYQEHKDTYTTVKYVEDTNLNSKYGRDNRIFDIQWGALTSHAVIDKMFNPGGFDIQKKAARISRILSEIGGGYTYSQLSQKSIKELDKILEEKATSKSILRPSTQIAFHKQNMTAGKLIGIFANNNTAHGFMSDMGIKLANIIPFKFNGRDVTSGMPIDDVIAKDGSYISKTIASFLAASVDAVKDPVLNDININTFTAGPAMVLARLGFDTDSIGLLMSQPVIKKLTSEFLAKSNEEYISASDIVSGYLTDHGFFGKALDAFKKTLSSENFTKDDMAKWMSKDAPQDEQRDCSIVALFSNLLDIATDLQEATFLTKFNSITNAAGPTIADTIVKKLRIERFFNKINLGQRNHLSDEAKNILKSNPLLNSFYSYTIGKDGASDLMFGNFFENSDRFMGILTNIEKVCDCNLDADDINLIFNEYVLYRLTSEGVVDGSAEGRRKFINDFPARFAKEAKGQISNELIDAILNKAKDQRVPVDTLEVQTGSMTIDQKDAIANAWSILINDEKTKQLAIDLFKYNLYRNGMAFSPMTFINLASVDVKQNIDGYVNTINGLTTADNEFADDEDNNFIFQFARNHPNNSKFVTAVDNFESMSTQNQDGTFALNDDTGTMFYYSKGNMYVRDKLTNNNYTKQSRLGIDYNFLEYDKDMFSHYMETVIGKAKAEDDTSKKVDPNTIPETPKPKEERAVMTQKDLDTLMSLMDAGEVMTSAAINNVDMNNDEELTVFMLKQAKIEQKMTTSEQVYQQLQEIIEKYETC